MVKIYEHCCQSSAARPKPIAATRPRHAKATVVAFFSLVASPVALPDSTATTQSSNGPATLVDKSKFTLFDPTPRKWMREMGTDRPDTTESPFTVDAGHFQAELSFLEYTREDEEGVVDQFAVMPMNLKVGLLDQVDLQLVLNPYVRVEGSGETIDGFGDLQLRTKVNLWGNDGGPTALAVMPFVQLPTAADDLGSDRVEGGVIVPFAADLVWGFSLGAMVELDIVRNSANDDYGLEWVHTIALGRDIAGPLGAYVEYIGMSPHQTGDGYQAAIGLGLTYGVTEDVQFDAGANFGLSREAEDITLFTGVSFRL